MDIEEVRRESVDWIHVTKYSVHCLVRVNTVMNFRIRAYVNCWEVLSVAVRLLFSQKLYFIGLVINYVDTGASLNKITEIYYLYRTCTLILVISGLGNHWYQSPSRHDVTVRKTTIERVISVKIWKQLSCVLVPHAHDTTDQSGQSPPVFRKRVYRHLVRLHG
jgi:hypothetical protein